MKNIAILLTFLLLIFQNKLHAKFNSLINRFEFDLGYTSLQYKENHEDQYFLNVNFTEKAITPKITFQSFLLPNYFYFTSNAKYIAYPISTSDDNYNIRILDVDGSFGVLIPGCKPVNITLVAEAYSTYMQTNSDTFGFKKLTGMHYYPLVDYTTEGGTTIYFKYPIWKSLSSREEMSAGVHFRLIMDKPMKYPFAIYQEALLLKIDYSMITLTFEDIRKVTIETKALTISLGYNW